MLDQHVLDQRLVSAYGCELKLVRSVASLKDPLKDNFFFLMERREGKVIFGRFELDPGAVSLLGKFKGCAGPFSTSLCSFLWDRD